MRTGETPTSRDLDILRWQLGRPARGVLAIAARCVCGNPLVVATTPRLDDGTPFPTFYYLTAPPATREASRLEAAGKMAIYEQRLRDNPEAGELYRLAHESYLHARTHWGVVEEIEGITAGGMPHRVKCLHALMAHSLAEGPGVNPVGDWALDDSRWSREVCECDPFD